MRNAEFGLRNELPAPKLPFRIPQSAFRNYSADSPHLRRPIRSIIPVLRGADIWHSPLMAVPAIEAIHLDGPEAGGEIAHHDQPVRIADVNAPGPRDDAPVAVVAHRGGIVRPQIDVGLAPQFMGTVKHVV